MTEVQVQQVNKTEVPSADPAVLAEAVWQDRVRVFLGRASHNVPNVLLGAAMIGLVLYFYGVPLSWLALWASGVGVFTVVLVVVDQRLARIALTADNRRSVLRWRMAAGGLLFLLYGLSPLLLTGPDNLLPHTWLMLIISTAMAVNAMSYATMPQYWLVLNAASMVPLTFDLAYHAWALADRSYLVMTLMAVVWQATVMLKVRSVAVTAVAALEAQWRLRFEIREHERTREQIQHMALHDELTGLANRRYFQQMFERTLHQATRGQWCFALVVLDLDDFKIVNDSLGHAAGDEVLRVTAQRIQLRVRAGDLVARLGGDEFAILLPFIRGPEDVSPVVHKLEDELAAPVVWQGRPVQIGSSMGWATFPDDSRDPDRLFALADERMYAVKAQHHQGVNSQLA